MYRLSANSRATISSTAIFLSQQSRQYRSSPRGSETSFAPHSAHRAWTTVLRDILQLYYVDCGFEIGDRGFVAIDYCGCGCRCTTGPYMCSAYCLTILRALK